MLGHNDGECSKVLEGRKRSAYVPKWMVRPGGAISNKGESSGNGRVAEPPLAVSAPVVTVTETRDMEVPLCHAQSEGTRLAVPDQVLLPESSFLAAEGPAVPAQAAVCPAVPAQPILRTVVAGQQLEIAQCCPTEELAGAKGGNRQGKKGKSRKSAGQQYAAAVQQQQVKEVPVLKTVGEGCTLGDHPLSSAGRGLEGVEGCLLVSSSGDGVAHTSIQIGTKGQCLAPVAAGGVSRSWAEECDADVRDIRPSERTASSATASKTKVKGKAPLPSK